MRTKARHRRPSRPSSRGVFITGTDTGVGKTLVTAALTLCLKRRGLRVGVMKPVETGSRDEGVAGSDAARLYAAAGLEEPVEAISPYRFADPLAPADAARREGRTISLSRIVRCYRALAMRYPVVLVEGAGGVLVPLTSTANVRDLMKRLALPAVVVSRAELGSVNHTLMTIEALRRARIPVLTVLLNRAGAHPKTEIEALQEASTLSLLNTRSGVPVVGPLPHHPRLPGAWEEGLSAVADSAEIGALADLVMGTARQRRGRRG